MISKERLESQERGRIKRVQRRNLKLKAISVKVSLIQTSVPIGVLDRDHVRFWKDWMSFPETWKLENFENIMLVSEVIFLPLQIK